MLGQMLYSVRFFFLSPTPNLYKMGTHSNNKHNTKVTNDMLKILMNVLN